MLRTALTLAERGLAVFPCWPRTKHPATEHGFKDATRDPDKLRYWWRRSPDYNIAIATGAVSGGIFVPDIDGLDGEAALRRLELQHGALPASVEAITPRPGRHIYLQGPPGTSVRNSAGTIAPGIDIRGDGGYVLVPPSIHPCGWRYVWSVDSASVFAPAPDWLLARVTARMSSGLAKPVPASEWRQLVADGVDDGQRDCSAARLAGYLLRRYLDPHVVLEIMQLWNAARCTPPLPAKDIVRIVGSIAKKELTRRQGSHD